MKTLAGSRLLCVLPQNPFDPCSGAARSVRTICELLAANGAGVDCLALGNVEGSWKGPSNDGGVWRGVNYSVYDTQARLQVVFNSAIQNGGFDLLFGFGGTPDAINRYTVAREWGLKIVFALRNHGYLDGGAEFFRPFAGVLTPSRYLSNVYSASLGVESTAIPPLIDLLDVIPTRDDRAAGYPPKYFTVINAGAPEKGRVFTMRLAPELVKRGIPVLLVEGRGGRFDCPGAVWMDPVAQPKEIYAKTKVLLVPSLWQEPAGRVVAEAALNGIPSIVSGRGGMIEMGPTCIRPISERITETYRGDVGEADVSEWLSCCSYVFENPRVYSIIDGRAVHPDVLGPRYLEYFERILNA